MQSERSSGSIEKGSEEPLSAEAKPYSHPRLSPDGTRLAVNSRGQDRDIWIFDLGRQTFEKLTSGTARELNPVWTPDSRMVLYASPREAGVDIVYRQRADGTGNSEALTSGKNHFYPISIAPKGHEVVLVDGSDSIMTLAVLHLDGTNRITSLLQNSSQNLNGEVSPDGRWLAYQSDETGRYEIFVRPYPNAQSGAKRTISAQRWNEAALGSVRERALLHRRRGIPDGGAISDPVRRRVRSTETGVPRSLSQP